MTPFDLLVAGVAVVAGAIAAVTGFGIGSFVTPVLAASIGTKTAVAIVAVPHLAATVFRLWGLRQHIDAAVLRTFGLASAVGGLIGALIHIVFSGPVLATILGLLLVFAGVSELTGFASRLRFPGTTSIVAGALSGLFGGLVGNQGGIRSAALLRFGLSREALVATATASALLVDAARVPIYLVTAGSDIARLLPLVGLLTAAVLVGTIAGAPILRRLPDAIFRRLLAILLIILGVSLVVGIGQ
jgi:uncharacterized membrane protein YfcA